MSTADYDCYTLTLTRYSVLCSVLFVNDNGFFTKLEYGFLLFNIL
jgi:hypothetical protein